MSRGEKKKKRGSNSYNSVEMVNSPVTDRTPIRFIKYSTRKLE